MVYNSRMINREQCWKCGGTGEYRPFGTCYACSGTGVAKRAQKPTAWWTKVCICEDKSMQMILCHIHSYDECMAARYPEEAKS